MEETLLLEKIHELKRRLRVVWMINGALAWCLPGALATLLLMLTLKLLDRPAAELTRATLALVLFPMGGAVAAGVRPLPLMGVALATDRKLGLKERLATALEWSLSDRPRTVVAQQMLKDASQHAAGVEPKNTFKVTVPVSLRRAAMVSGVASILLLLPPWHLFQPRQSAEEIKVVRQASERLQRTAKDLRERFPRSRQTQATAGKLEELARRLKEPGTDRQEAAARVSNLAEQLRSQARSQGSGKADSQGKNGVGTQAEQAERLKQLARRLSQEGATPELSRALQKELERADPQSQQAAELKKAQQALDKQDGQAAGEAVARAAEAAGQQAAQDQGTAGEVAQTLQSVESGLSQEVARQNGSGPAGQQPGQNGPGQNLGQQAQPNNGGQVTQSGKDGKEVPADFGKGTTNKEAGPGEGGEHKNYIIERQGKGKSSWTEEYKRLYASERVHQDTANASVKGNIRPGQMLPSQGQVRGAPCSQPGAGSGAEEVYLNYKREAEEAVTRQNVPAEYRDLVRNYFDGIDPR